MTGEQPAAAAPSVPNTDAGERSNQAANRGSNSRMNNKTIRKFKGKVEGVLTLAAKNERTGYGFASFIKSLYEHCLVTMKSPQDLAPVLLERKDPFVEMGKSLPSVRSVAESMGMPLQEIEEDDTLSIKKAKERKNDEIRENVGALVTTEINEFAKRRTQLRSNMAQLWGLTVGQCSPALQEHLKAQEGYTDNHGDYNCVWLLETLQLLAAGNDAATNPYVSAVNALRQLYRLKQFNDESLEDYLARFEEYVDQVRLSKVKMVSFEDAPAGQEELTSAEQEDRFLAIIFLKGADPARYSALWTDLQNDMSLATDKYPTTVSRAMHLLTTWRDPTRKQPNGGTRNNNSSDRREGVTFAQVARSGEANPGIDRVVHAEIKCYHCNDFGHYSSSMPEARQPRSRRARYSHPCRSEMLQLQRVRSLRQLVSKTR